MKTKDFLIITMLFMATTSVLLYLTGKIPAYRHANETCPNYGPLHEKDSVCNDNAQYRVKHEHPDQFPKQPGVYNAIPAKGGEIIHILHKEHDGLNVFNEGEPVYVRNGVIVYDTTGAKPYIIKELIR